MVCGRDLERNHFHEPRFLWYLHGENHLESHRGFSPHSTLRDRKWAFEGDSFKPLKPTWGLRMSGEKESGGEPPELRWKVMLGWGVTSISVVTWEETQTLRERHSSACTPSGHRDLTSHPAIQSRVHTCITSWVSVSSLCFSILLTCVPCVFIICTEILKLFLFLNEIPERLEMKWNIAKANGQVYLGWDEVWIGRWGDSDPAKAAAGHQQRPAPSFAGWTCCPARAHGLITPLPTGPNPITRFLWKPFPNVMAPVPLSDPSLTFVTVWLVLSPVMPTLPPSHTSPRSTAPWSPGGWGGQVLESEQPKFESTLLSFGWLGPASASTSLSSVSWSQPRDRGYI